MSPGKLAQHPGGVRELLITPGHLPVIRRQGCIKHLLSVLRPKARLCRQREIVSLLSNQSQVFHPRNVMHSAEPEQPGNSTYARHWMPQCRQSQRRWQPVAWSVQFAVSAIRIRLLDLGRLAAQGYGHVPLIELPLRCQCGSRDCDVAVSGRSVRDGYFVVMGGQAAIAPQLTVGSKARIAPRPGSCQMSTRGQSLSAV